MKNVLCLVLVGMMSMVSYAATVAYWDFEDGVAGQPFTPEGEPGGSGGSADTVNGYMMYGWDHYWGPSWTSPGVDSALAMKNADNHQDGYATDPALKGWSPSTWTVECAVYLEEIAGWETMIGRDGSSQSESASDFYLSNNGIDDRFRIDVDTVGGQRWILDGDYTVQTNTWYALAAMSDGVTLSLWLDDGSGYAQIGSLDISAQSVADNALAATNYNWTFGRGWFDGNFVDHIDGMMDNIRFSDTALAAEELIPIPEPATLTLLGLGALPLLRKRK